jgi:UDP-N-acetylmuramate--alanine ligase
MTQRSFSSVHFIGIGGTGLSAIARVLLERGYSVSGSDRQLSPLAENLCEAGVRVEIGHRAENIGACDLVVRSSAVREDNPEVAAALQRGIPVLKRAEFLGALIPPQACIAVAGSHGKTTTTAMIAWMLTAIGGDPSYIIGGVSQNLGNNAHAGTGAHFVIEADEYDHMFWGLSPNLAVVTNVDHDHPDCYPTPEDFYQAFRGFAGRIVPGGCLLACGDDPGAARLLAECGTQGIRTLAYGTRRMAHTYTAHDLRPNARGGFDAQVAVQASILTLSLQVPGVHNIFNALAALAIADQLELPLDRAAAALHEFAGTGRRFEVRGEVNGVTLVDDYAHHPAHIRATLAAARSRYPGRTLWAVWQPHTFSRTRVLLQDYAHSFEDADHVLVTEVYAAREPRPEDGFSAASVVAHMRHADARFLQGLPETAAWLRKNARPGDVVLVLSAGDADQIITHWIQTRFGG